MTVESTEPQAVEAGEDAAWQEFAAAEGLTEKPKAEKPEAEPEEPDKEAAEEEIDEPEADAEPDKEEAGDEPQAKPKSGSAKLKAQRDEARAALDKAQAELTAMRSQAAPDIADGFVGKAPDRADYESVYDYDRACTAYDNRKAIAEFNAYQQRTAIQRQEAIAHAAVTATFNADMAELVSEIPDAQTVLNSADPANQAVAQAIYNADNPARVAYAIAKQGLVGRLNAMNPLQAALAIGRLEASISKPAPKVSKAPDPVPNVKGGATPKKSLDKMSDDEVWATWERADGKKAFS
jgi:hypothetical protein